MSRFTFPTYNEIPDVGLYLEQVTKYINEILAPLDIPVTGSMISNYVKKDLIPRPVKKQYSREQIALLIFISLSKCILSLEDIQILVSQNPQTNIKETYEAFCKEFISVMDYVFEEKAIVLPAIELGSPEKLRRNTIITICHKLYLEQCFKEMKK